MSILQDNIVHLVLLDIDLKDQNGLNLLTAIRNKKINIEVILITAANESETVMQGFHLDILDYLNKPFSFERFEQSIQ
ncbi:response regulator [Aerococcaceae bacterium WGS1372]